MTGKMSTGNLCHTILPKPKGTNITLSTLQELITILQACNDISQSIRMHALASEQLMLARVC